MKVKLSWKEIGWTIAVLLFLFVLLPIGFWQYATWRQHAIKDTINDVIPEVIHDANDSIQVAVDFLTQEVTSTSQSPTAYRAQKTAAAIGTMCIKIDEAIRAHNPDLIAGGYYSCALSIERGNIYLHANQDSVYQLEDYEPGFQDLVNLAHANELWHLNQYGRTWKVQYKLKTEPSIILDFEIRTEER